MGILIGLHSQPRAGKDTLAKELIAHRNFIKLSFAEPLYNEVSAAFGVPVIELESHLWKTTPRHALAAVFCNNPTFREILVSKGYDVTEPLTSRCILQLWGTEYRRHQQSDYWVEKMVRRLHQVYGTSPRVDLMPHDINVVITDTRVYQEPDGTPVYNEVEALERFSQDSGVEFLLVEITRDSTVHTGHGSDDRFPDRMISTTLTNNGTPVDLYEQFTSFIEEAARSLHV